MKKHYPVIIIGAGPAGLMAARELKKAGIDFLVIDSKKEIGLPLKCGEGVRRQGFESLFGRKNYPFIKNRTDKIEVIGGNARRVLKIRYILLDRPIFEQWLAEPVLENISLRTVYLDVIKRKGCLEVLTNKGSISSGLVILAAGCDYRVQKKFGMMSKAPEMIPCYGGIFRSKAKAADLKTLRFIFDEDNAAAAWIFHKDRDTANIGIGMYPKFVKKDIRAVFDEMVKKFNIVLEGKPNYAGSFPTTGPIRRTYADRLMACGNAAGQVYAGSGEGIYFSLKAGELAGKTAVEAVNNKRFSSGFLKRYEKAWKQSFGKELAASLQMSAILFLGLKYKKLGKLFRIPSDEELYGLIQDGKVPRKVPVAASIAYICGLYAKGRQEPPKALLWMARRFAKKRLEEKI